MVYVFFPSCDTRVGCWMWVGFSRVADPVLYSNLSRFIVSTASSFPLHRSLHFASVVPFLLTPIVSPFTAFIAI
ncbi:hypothetical protein L1887_13801 [Cichorium endivia]|nr:hypothetical protein L1887_13801 [Cichorium endivia]